MKEALKVALREALQPSLEPGETVEVESLAGIGEVSIKKMAAQALVVGVLTLGTVTAYTKPRPLYVALTDRRLLFVEPNVWSGKPTTKIVAQLPRTAASTVSTKAKRILGITPTLLVDLALPGSAKGLRLQFATINRGEGAQIAEALSAAA